MARFERLSLDDIVPVWRYDFDEAVKLAVSKLHNGGTPVLVQLAHAHVPAKEDCKRLNEFDIPLVSVSNAHGHGAVTPKLRDDTLAALRHRAQGKQPAVPPSVDSAAADALAQKYEQAPPLSDEQRADFLKELYGRSGDDDGVR